MSDVAGLEALTIDSFAARVGESFTLEHPQGSCTLVLAACEPAGQGLGRQAFSLSFLGPAEPTLPQQIHRLGHGELGALELFLVPLGRDADGTRYEAVFT